MTPAWQVKTASDVATGRDFKKKQITKAWGDFLVAASWRWQEYFPENYF
jgi:hypothetical protein